MGFTADLESTLAADWARAMAQIAEGCREGVAHGTEEAAEQARTHHPYKDRSPDGLTKSIRGVVETYDRLGAEGVLEARADHASFVEDGTRPHVIRPKAETGFVGPLYESQTRRKRGTGGARKFLRFEGSDGAVHFARAVHHPGTKSMPFMGPAVQKFERVVEREVEVAAARAQSELDK